MTVQSIVQKKVLFKEHSAEYLTVFSLLMFLCFLPFAPRINFDLSIGTLGLLYIFATLSVFVWLLLIKAYRHMQLSSVEPLKNLSPLVVLIFAYLFLGETITWSKGGGIALLILGAYILEATLHHANILRPFKLFEGKYMHFMLLSLFLAGITTVLGRYLVLQTSALTALFFLFFFASINLLLIQFIFYEGMNDIVHVFKTNGILVLVVVAATFISDLAYFTALAFPAANTALIISLRRFSTLLVTLIGGEFFHETRLLTKSVACGVMLIGVYLIIV